MTRDEEFFNRLKVIFKAEAAEHLSAIMSGIFWLQSHRTGDDSLKAVEGIFRSFHSLKGSSALVNFSIMEKLCQSIEDLLAKVKRGDLILTDEIIDSLNDSGDIISSLIEDFETGPSDELLSRAEMLLDRFAKITSGGTVFEKVTDAQKNHYKEAGKEESLATDDNSLLEGQNSKTSVSSLESNFNLSHVKTGTIRVSVDKLEEIMALSDEFVIFKITMQHCISELKELKNIIAQNYHEYHDKNFLKELDNRLSDFKYTISNNYRIISNLVDDFHGEMKGLLLMPFDSLFESIPKFVRDVARENGKDIELILEGGGVEIDRRVLQAMKDPFLHLIRNAIDHGIESIDERIKKGKDKKGRLKIAAASVLGGKIEIVISDDGRGIDPDKVKESALAEGVISQERLDTLSADEVYNLIFESGVSTSPMITNISGRGLGMAIVREEIEKLGGSIHIDSEYGKGTAFKITLPVEIATFRGILIESSGTKLAIPTKNVVRMLRVKKDDIKTIEGIETILFFDEPIPLVPLAAILNFSNNKPQVEQGLIVMVLHHGGKHIAISIDNVLYENEMIMKGLGKQLVRVKNISGATLLATGEVVPVLNSMDLIKSAMKLHGTSLFSGDADEKRESSKDKKVLVVEDSLTARSLYVSIFEGAGYKVTSAVDGVDGFTKLINGDFDLVVSDVQMPKMNGFELTKKIRSSDRFSSMPVILITGLESSDDKRKGIEAGANAYIVKSSFDQDNLLDVVRRFI